MPNPLENGFTSAAQEENIKKENPNFWRIVVRKFGSYGSAKHRKHLRNNKRGR